MKYDTLKHHRRSVRLAGFDYATPGAYYVTIVTSGRAMFFDQPALRGLAEACWRAIPAHAPNVRLDEWVVMPNHLHGIIIIGGEEGKDNRGNLIVRRGVQLNAPTVNDDAANANDSAMRDADNDENNDRTANANGSAMHDDDNVFSMMSPRRNTLAVIVRTYKAAVTTACREAELVFGWQRGYHEHVVRGTADLNRIRAYIQNNPARWAADLLNPARLRQLQGGK